MDDNKSCLDYNETDFIFDVIDITDKSNRVQLLLRGEEDVIGTYYYEDINDKNELLDMLKYGMKVRVSGSLIEPKENTIPYNFNYKKYLNNRDIYYQFKIDEIKKVKYSNNIVYLVKNIMNDRISKIDNSGYMMAFILGDNSKIDSEVYDIYQNIGVTHLFALSGMHVGLLSAIFLKLFSKINKNIKYILVILLLVFYGFIVGFPASIFRTIVFFIISSFNKIFGLSLSSIKVFIMTIFFLILTNFKIIMDVSFLYSAIIVMGIIVSSSFIGDSNKVISSLKLSFIALIFSLPITLYFFYEINFLSIIYNLIYIPYVTIIVYPMSLISFIFPFLSDVFNLLTFLMERLAFILDKINFGRFCLSFNIWEVFLFYIILLFIILRKRYMMFGLLFFIILIDIVIPYTDGDMKVYFLDVGQGDSTLIITPYRKEIILIDTGGKVSYESDFEIKKSYVSDGTLTFLKAMGFNKIDYLILTHGDYDHMGDAIHLVENIKIKNVIFNKGEFNYLERNLIEKLNEYQINYEFMLKKLNISSGDLFFLNNEIYDNENDNSIVIYFLFDGYKFMLMGDAGTIVEQDLIKKYNLENIDVLKVGHHGSNSSTSYSFVNLIKPRYSIISVGENNRYGHPNKEVLDTLDKSIIYRTDKNGSIIVKINKHNFDIDTT